MQSTGVNDLPGPGSSPRAVNQPTGIDQSTPVVVNSLAVPVGEKPATAEPALATAPTLNSWLETVTANSADPKKPDLLFVEAFRALESHIRNRLNIDAHGEIVVSCDTSISTLPPAPRKAAVPLGELYVEIPKDISPTSRSIVLSLFDHPTKRVNDGVSAIITVTLGYRSKDPQLVDGTFADPEAGWQITSFLGPKYISDLLMSGGIPLHTPFRAPEGAAREAWVSRQVGDAAGPLMKALQQVSGRSKLPVAPEEKYAQLMGVIGVVLQTQLGIDSPSSENPLAGIIASLSAGLTPGSPAAQLQYERTVNAFNTQLGDALGIQYQERVTISAAPQQLSNWRQIAEQSRATGAASIESVRLAAIEWLEGYCRKQLEIPAGEGVVLGSTESGTGRPADAGDDGRFGLPYSVRLEDLYPEFSRSSSRLQTIKLHVRPEAVGVESSMPVVMIAMELSAENGWRICVVAAGAAQTRQHQALAFPGLTDENAADYTLSTN